MEIQTINQDTIGILKTDKEISGIILLTSPMYEDDHLYEVSYYGGRPYTIRGDVKINDDSTQTTITEIDFETSLIQTLSRVVPRLETQSLSILIHYLIHLERNMIISPFMRLQDLNKEKPSVSDSSAVADSVTLDNDTLPLILNPYQLKIYSPLFPTAAQ